MSDETDPKNSPTQESEQRMISTHAVKTLHNYAKKLQDERDIDFATAVRAMDGQLAEVARATSLPEQVVKAYIADCIGPQS